MTLKKRIGGTFCEFVPKNPADVHLIVDCANHLRPWGFDDTDRRAH
jgi:hypothetical protein